MGFRFRKSFGKGPFRVNISKSGVGYSIGSKGFRYTKKAGGGTRTTASIPGTGISYVTDSGKKSHISANTQSSLHSAVVNSSPAPQSRCCRFCGKPLQEGSSYCFNCERFQDDATDTGITSGKPLGKRWWIWVIVGLVALRACGAVLGADEPAPTEPIVETQSVVTIAATTPTEQAPVETHWMDNTSIKINTGSSGKTQTYVLNTSTMKFHEPGCSSVEEIADENKSTHSGNREDVMDRGYEPCGHCNP